jgi:hypothetical protein
MNGGFQTAEGDCEIPPFVAMALADSHAAEPECCLEFRVYAVAIESRLKAELQANAPSRKPLGHIAAQCAYL